MSFVRVNGTGRNLVVSQMDQLVLGAQMMTGLRLKHAAIGVHVY